jgi:hypothetical protein
LNICIEFDGEQHFKPCGWFGSESPQLKLQRTKKNDKIKNNFCKKNNVKLIRIPYTKIKKIKLILNKKLYKYLM